MVFYNENLVSIPSISHSRSNYKLPTIKKQPRLDSPPRSNLPLYLYHTPVGKGTTSDPNRVTVSHESPAGTQLIDSEKIPSSSKTWTEDNLQDYGISKNASAPPSRLQNVYKFLKQQASNVPEAVLHGLSLLKDPIFEEFVTHFRNKPNYIPSWTGKWYTIQGTDYRYPISQGFVDYFYDVMLKAYSIMDKMKKATEETWRSYIHSIFEHIFLLDEDLSIENNAKILLEVIDDILRPDAQFGVSVAMDKLFSVLSERLGFTLFVAEEKRDEQENTDEIKLLIMLSGICHRMKTAKTDLRWNRESSLFPEAFSIGISRSGPIVSVMMLWPNEAGDKEKSGEGTVEAEAKKGRVQDLRQKFERKKDEPEKKTTLIDLSEIDDEEEDNSLRPKSSYVSPDRRERLDRKAKHGGLSEEEKRDVNIKSHYSTKHSDTKKGNKKRPTEFNRYNWTWLITDLDISSKEGVVAYAHLMWRLCLYCKQVSKEWKAAIKGSAEPKEFNFRDQDALLQRIKKNEMSEVCMFSSTNPKYPFYIKKRFTPQGSDSYKRELYAYKLLERYNFIPRVFSVNEQQASLNIAYVPNQKVPLDTLLELKQVYRKIMDALVVFEMVGLVHNDISRANILICRRRDDVEVKFIDFSYSWCNYRQEKILYYGTQGYIAPEVWNGRSRPSTKSDIFSVGVLLMEDLLGLRCGGQRDMLDMVESFGGLQLLQLVERTKGKLRLSECWRRLSGDAVDLVSLLTSLDAMKRPSASGALSHSFFR